MSDLSQYTGWLVHLALLFYGLGFMIRDELWLRILVLIGTFFYLLYYYFFPASPLWDAIFASSVLGIINIVLIIIIIRERTLFAMNSEEAGLFQAFSTLTPGQFRKMMKVGAWRTANSPATLTREGLPSDTLYYVVSGAMTAQKSGHSFELDPEKFIGEIAFLTGSPASATVTAMPDCVYIEWKSSDIRRLMAKSQAFENALAALFNFDLARKVAAATGR